MSMQVPWQGPKWEIVAACYSLKGGRADFLMEKAAELGAFAVRPILTVRSPYLGKLLLMASSTSRQPADLLQTTSCVWQEWTFALSFGPAVWQ